jgi:predicted enzyme related to lactoylglutathione lyase
MKPAAVATISHIGICCSNVEQSIAFYTGALGFVHERSIDTIGPPYDTLTELPGFTFSAHYMRCGDVTIELIGYPDSAVTGTAVRRPMNQLGFTHMTLIVEDVEAVAARVLLCGGQIHTGTRIDSPFGPMLFCTDPNGVRIELMQSSG